MPTLKTTISLASTTLFPIPVNMSVPVLETIDGSHTGFQTVVIGSAAIATLYTSTGIAGVSGVTYFYAQAPVTNTDAVTIRLTRTDDGNVNCDIATLNPGDIMYTPIAASDATSTIISALNNSAIDAANLSFFYGEKG